jgi:hypothetical protein
MASQVQRGAAPQHLADVDGVGEIRCPGKPRIGARRAVAAGKENAIDGHGTPPLAAYCNRGSRQVDQCVLTCDSQGVLKSSDSAKELWPDIFFNRPICPP